ncbi:Eae-like protein [Salmonella enterica subsp. enterica]|nr:Eae-like protein [Salmonella enterica subsp. enterica serovar Bareilly]EBG0485815.1 Eae-like protein [Salmonella enterica subsp. enterica serovar Bareilly]
MKEVKIYTIVSDQLSPPITGESFCTDMVRHSDYAELEAKYAVLTVDNDKAMESLKQADAVVKLAHEKFSALAAENAGLKHAMAVTLEHVSVTDAGQAGVAAMIINDALHHGETPATDAFLAEVRASARNEGINYAASRLAAAFNHGFLDKPVSEVLDVTRMILSAKEDLANDPLPADDGLSGEYAEKSIKEWAAQLRKGGAA